MLFRSMSSGWMDAETDAKMKEYIYIASARQELAIMLRIIQISNEVPDDMGSLKLGDIDIKFSRSRTYDLATKVNSLVALIGAGIEPLRAIETVGLFTDPQQVMMDSIDRIDKILFSGTQQNTETHLQDMS